MKKIFFLLTGILLLTGCGKPQIEHTELNIVPNSTIEDNKVIVTHMDASKNPDIKARIGDMEITAKELWDMTPFVFKDWCELHYPGIADYLDVPWDNIDWALAKELIYEEVFGYEYPEWAVDTEEKNPETYLSATEIIDLKAFLGIEKFPIKIITPEDGDIYPGVDMDLEQSVILFPPIGFTQSLSDEDWIKYALKVSEVTGNDANLNEWTEERWHYFKLLMETYESEYIYE